MNIDQIKRVLILGSGTMGQQIGYLCALHGFEVVIYDISGELLEKAEKRIRKMTAHMGLYDAFTKNDFQKAPDRISYSNDPEKAAKDVDIVNESIPEDPKLKGRIFNRFNSLCSPETIFTTNTSSLLPSMFADATGRPEKFCALHFHVVTTTKVVDVMPHPGTSQQTIDVVTRFAKKIGQIPIVLKKEHNGYIYNHMLMGLIESALNVASKNIAAPEDIDRAWMGVMNADIGPFGIIDGIGIGTAHKVTDYWANIRQSKKAMANAAFLKKYVDAGTLGVMTGKGFYSYPGPLYAEPGFVKGAE